MKHVARWCSENVGIRELVLATGLLLLSSGLAQLSPAAALIVPGAILTWLAIPPAATRKGP